MPMDINSIKDKLDRFSDEYKKVGKESVIRKNHMNDLWDKEKVSNDIVVKSVDNFVKKVQEIQEIPVIITAIDFLEFLTNIATQENESKEWDAVLVDFINYVAMRYCIDYALYTIDLKKERLEQSKAS